MMGYYYGAGAPVWMWIVGTLMMLVFWGGLAVLIVWAVRATTSPRESESTEEILKRRLAAGHITQEDYEKGILSRVVDWPVVVAWRSPVVALDLMGSPKVA